MNIIKTTFSIFSLCLLIIISGSQKDELTATQGPSSPPSEKEIMLFADALAKGKPTED